MQRGCSRPRSSAGAPARPVGLSPEVSGMKKRKNKKKYWLFSLFRSSSVCQHNSGFHCPVPGELGGAGKGPCRSTASLGFPCGELGQHGDVWLQEHTEPHVWATEAVLSPCSLPHHRKARVDIFSVLSCFHG